MIDMPDFKECTKPHPLLHSVAGIGLGLLLVGLVPDLVAKAVVLGIILLVVGVGGELVIKK
ncbi:hypothetical protein A3H87_03895 [Candidatus Curtissbacteria bacterium RIFCSPLOWO2_02_FULL_42_37]|uniref:Uncharacterized protein n=1 Tax=Candidatus Curtissbacteria bacterium RIFCSPLOWO2_01_FULL_42_50 TaxID=1797730 RepID=A0A1F5H5J4_9BACT|nr:MAG: hypothetical protein A3B54_00875 [Candidatus Curtissbacteria bacterium RIFCSPLOWO2_01_FULL_42_50]OGE11716.1 MAG: hypothetical protein A3H87_03895 [Candidatus Curtissbacteria bacterium RIFCSPLOWO2_02_FULL_42_37]